MANKTLGLIAIALLIGLFTLIRDQHSHSYSLKNSEQGKAQPGLEEVIRQGFQKGEVAVLYPFFDELISICIEDVEEIYLAYNAKTAMQNFFHAHPPQEFIINHKGTNKGGKDHFYIGEYRTKNKENFSVYIFAEKGLISSIEINREIFKTEELN